MLDLSYLTEEEQEAIMAVLKRDAELKKSEEERVKHVQKQGSDEGKLKYITGEWFYEVKSQRHQDRIHGSDIIMASMKQKKPMTVEFLTQTWRERPSKTNNNLMTPQPEPTDNPKERRPKETQQESINRQRHNPFNNVPIDLEMDLPNGASFPESMNSPEVLSPKEGLKIEGSQTEAKTKAFDILHEAPSHQKPVPKKRTKIFQVQNSVTDSNSSISTVSVSTNASVSTQSVSTTPSSKSPVSSQSMSTSSDSTSTLSTLSMTTNSEIRSLPPKGILKHSSSFSSSDSNIKSQLPQPIKSLSKASSVTGSEQILEESAITQERIDKSSVNLNDNGPLKPTSPIKSTIPKSRLPVRSSLLLNNPTQTEKPKAKPRLSRSSSTQSNNEEKTTDNVIYTKQKSGNSLNCSVSTEAEKQKPVYDIIKEPRSIPRKKATSPFESLLVKPINNTTSQITPKNLEKEESKAFKREHKKTEEKANRPVSITAQCVYEATNPTNASNKTESPPLAHQSDYRPRPFNIKVSRDTKMDDCKDPLMMNSHFPKTSEEQGDSIAKVLEWFSRSSDSSDKHDCEEILQDTEDIKIDDIDFEEDLNSRPKPENNVYLIVPKHTDEDAAMINDEFFNLAVEMNVHKKQASINSQGVQELIGETNPLSAKATSGMGSYNTSAQDTPNRLLDSRESSLKEKLLETASKKEECRNVDQTEISDLLQHDLEGSCSPKTANLRSMWDGGSTESPGMLVSKPSINLEQENQNYGVKKATDHEEEPTKVDIISPKYSALESKEQSYVEDNYIEIESDNTVRDSSKKQAHVRDKANEMQAQISDINQMKDVMAQNITSDKDKRKHLSQKSSSLDFVLQLGDQSKENVGGNINSSGEGYMTSEVLELDQLVKSEEKGSRLNPQPTPNVHLKQQIHVSLVKQSKQQQDNRAERIKALKSFWEREELQSKKYIKSTAEGKSPVKSTKLNKRFTKSEHDLTSIGTETEAETVNFTVLPLRERVEKSVTEEGMNRLQFKMLRDFWAETSRQSSNQEGTHAKTHKELELVDARHSLNQNVCPNQSDQGFGNDSGNAMSPKTDRGLQLSPKAKIDVKYPETDTTDNLYISPNELDVLRSSDYTHPKSGTQFSPKDKASPKPAGLPNKESQQQTTSSGKGTLNGRGNSFRRAISMFAVNIEDQDEDLELQSRKVSDTVLPQVGKTTESTVFSSTRTPEVNLQVKKNSVVTKHKVTERSTSEDSDSQTLATSFLPRDYQHYLGTTEKRGKDISPQDKEQMSELVCTTFQTDGVRCWAEQDDNTLDSELCSRRGNLERQISSHASEDIKRGSLNRDDSFSGTSSNLPDGSIVQEALRRAATRPVYHKSLEDITAVPISSTPSRSTSSFSDRERMRKISKSVPNFLETEDDGNESDSECSSNSEKYWKNSNPQAKLSSSSRMAALSSMSGSIISISSADYANIKVQGIIKFSINYVQKMRELHIFVVQCQNLAPVDMRRNRSDPYVKSYLIPDTANLGKRKTSVKKKTLNPIYNEILRYKVQMEYVKTEMLNLSVWHNDTFGRNSFLGETEIDLSKWDFENPQINCLSLKQRATSSILLTDDRGEMRLAIRFLPHISLAKSGEIHIWVKDCKNLPPIRGGAINPYVKCLVLPDTSKKSCQKTRVLKRASSPVFNHTMVYDGFRAEDLKETCVDLTVWDHERLSDHLVGGVRLSLGTGQTCGKKVDWMDSVANEVELWQRMIDSPNEWVEDVLPLRMMTTAKNTWK
ncbi:synaptotagmin-like protein 2 [Silurus asotus]|uniref:Synaptotagmin-like protein 2 n=1 Tax=Silurus asotus TaxID=30991 RepID=A0AAD5AS30_SILAS|nr:synaptotagmin-like protein 2 [Silurus asotus]